MESIHRKDRLFSIESISETSIVSKYVKTGNKWFEEETYNERQDKFYYVNKENQ